MKKLLLTVCTMAGLLPAMAQTTGAAINGHTSHKSKEPMKLYGITHGRLQEIASSRVDERGKFGFLFYPASESYYVIGSGNESSMMGKYSFYFKPGDQLNLDLNDTSYTLVGKNTGENKAIAQWHDKAHKVEQQGLYAIRNNATFKEFFPELEALVASQKTYKSLPSGNTRFDREFAYTRQLDLLNYAITFMSSPNSVFPTTNEYTAYYKGIKTEEYTKDTRLYACPAGARLISFLPLATSIIAGKELTHDTDTRLAQISNDTLKGETVIEDAGRLKSYIGYQDLQTRYQKYIFTEDQKQRLAAIGTKLANEAAKPGQKAINFTYPDINGKMTSLSDFKGKVVIVDVWATWCGPCKKEIPSLKKMEEEMRGKDIVFMSVSVDEAKDEQKWKDFVAKEELKGVQLFASGWSDIAKNYNIKGIPRFMVFDKKGNIVSVDAPRPSGKELALLLEAELKK